MDRPGFFHGFAAHPLVVTRSLLVLTDITATRHLQHPSADTRAFAVTAAGDILRGPVLASNGDRLRAERFSACNGVLTRLDLLVTGLDGGDIGHRTANVDIGPTMRRALALVLRGALLAFAIRCGITARWAVSLRQAVGHLGDDLLAQLLAERGARFAAEYIGREPNGRRAVGRRHDGLWIRVVREPGSRPASRTTSSYGWLLALSALTGTGEESRDPEPFKAELKGHLDFAVELLLAPQGSLGGPLRLPLLPRERRTGAHPLEGVGQGSLASPRTPHRALPGRAGVSTAIHRAHRLGASSPGSGFPRAPRSRWRRRHTWRAQCWPPSSPGRPPSVAGLQPRHGMAAVEPGEAPATAPEQPGLRAVAECPGSSEAVRLARESVGRLSRAGKSDPAGKRSPR